MIYAIKKIVYYFEWQNWNCHIFCKAIKNIGVTSIAIQLSIADSFREDTQLFTNNKDRDGYGQFAIQQKAKVGVNAIVKLNQFSPCVNCQLSEPVLFGEKK